MLRSSFTLFALLTLVLTSTGCIDEFFTDDDEDLNPDPVTQCPYNTTPDCSDQISLGSLVTGLADRDRYYRLDLASPGIYELDLQSMPTSGRLDFEVQDAEFNRVVREVFNAGSPGSFVFEVSQAGAVYVIADAITSSTRDESFQFGVSLVRQNETPSSCNQNVNPQCAVSIALGQPVTGLADRDRYYRLDLASPGIYELDLQSMPTSGRLDFEVQDAEFNRVVREVFNAGSPGSFVFEVSQAGAVYVIADAITSSTRDELFTFRVKTP